MNRDRKREFENLVEYFVGRCLESAGDQDKDEYIESLVDFRNINYNYLDQRESLGANSNKANANTLDIVFSDYWIDLYEELLDEPPTYRTELISAVTGIIRESSEKGFVSSYGQFFSILNRVYQKQTEAGVFDDNTKRFFVRRYSLIIRKAIEDIQNTESQEDLDREKQKWSHTIKRARRLLKLSIESGDTKTYSKIMSELSEISSHDIVSDRAELDDSFLENKYDIAEDIESEISLTAFVLTAWAFRLLKKGEIKESEFSKIASVTESERTSIKEISDIYYNQIHGNESLGYWDQWEMNEKLEKSMGVVTTSPAVFTWLKEFFCYELFRLGEQVYADGELDLGENPFPSSQRIINEAEKIEEKMNSIREEPVVQNIIDPENIDDIIDSFVSLYKEAKESYEETVRNEVRESDLDPGKKDEFKESVKRSFAENCALRNTLKELGIISTNSLEEYETYDLGEYRVPRRALVSVEDDIPLSLSPQRYSSPIQDNFQDLILEKLKFDRETFEGKGELLEKVREYIDSREVKVILASQGANNSIFRDSEGYEYALGSQERVFENQTGLFLDTPIIRMRSNKFSILLLYEESPQLIEKNPAEPISIEMISAEEDISDEDLEQLSEEERENIRDWINAYVSYSCYFQPNSKTGAHFELEGEI